MAIAIFMQLSCNLILKSPMQKNSIDNLERKEERQKKKEQKERKKERNKK